MEGWALFFNGLTALSTFAMMIATGFMAFFAGKALDSWKNQQKRQKLINLLEGLNKYIQELQLYELESIVYSKQCKNIPENYDINKVNIWKDKYNLLFKDILR